MKKIITCAVTAAILTVAGAPTGHTAWFGGVEVKNDMSRKDDNSQKYGNNASVDSNNQSSSVTNRNDNRRWQTTTTSTDNRQWIDQDYQRHQSHNYGDGSIVINGEGYKPRVGHEQVSIGGVSGSGNYFDDSVSGDFSIGHRTGR